MHRSVRGRVLARTSPTELLLLLDGVPRVFQLANAELLELTPGALITAQTALDTPNVLHSLVVVQRPVRDPFGADTETTRLSRGVREALFERAAVLQRIRSWLLSQEFLEVDTPSCVVSPGLDLHLHAFEVRAPDGARAGYLSTSPEYQLKRLLAGGIERCFQFAHVFRAEELGRRHEPEFTLLEWYRCWADFETLLADTEAIVRAASRDGSLHAGAHRVSLREPFERCTVREAFERFAPEEGDPVTLCDRDEERYFRVLVERIEPRLGFDRPCFLTHYPASQASLARLSDEDPTVAERVELYAAGVELCNGFVELTDAHEQRKRLERDQAERRERGLPVYPIDERFLSALEEGMPPAIGNAMGLDRLVALVLGREAIEAVLAIPAHRR